VPSVPAALPGRARRRPRGGSTGVLRRDRGSASPGGIRRGPRATQEEKLVCLAKPPFAGPEAVLADLARYTHRVAISNSRLINLDESGVTFRYKDYRCNGRARFCTMT